MAGVERKGVERNVGEPTVRAGSPSVEAAYEQLRKELLRKLTVDALREVLRLQKRPVSGIKTDLVERALGEGSSAPVIGGLAAAAVLYVAERSGQRPPGRIVTCLTAADRWITQVHCLRG